MSKYDTSFVAAVENRKRQICLDLLRENPQTTLAELHQLTRGEIGKVLGSVTIGDLLSPEVRAAEAPARPVPAPPKAKVSAKARPKPFVKPVKVAEKIAERPAPRPAPKPIPAEVFEMPLEAEEVNTRTPTGRDAFDSSVYETLKLLGGPVGAGEIQKHVGGTNMQVRSSVNRLIEQGKVTWTGKARGTRYRLA